MITTLITQLAPALIKGGLNLFRGHQKRQEAKQEIKAKWELAQTEKYPWFVSLFAAVHIIGPVDYAFYLSLRSAWPIDSPAEMNEVIQQTLTAFPVWWTGAFVTILLAMMGIRVNGQEKVNQARAKALEHKAEAEKIAKQNENFTRPPGR